MALSSYDIDFTKMVTQLLPTVLRTPVRISWLVAVLKPLRTLHNTILSFRSARVDDVKWNGQTIKLEQLLITKFGAGIFITNNIVYGDGFFVGADSTDISAYIGGGADYSHTIDSVYLVNAVNFTVNVPVAIVFTMSEMMAYINKYKMFGTTYNIVTF